MSTEVARAVTVVRGRVQGVGFRWWTRSRALELGLAGQVRNLPDGGVEVDAQGPREQVERLLALLDEQPSTGSRPGWVEGTTTQWQAPVEGASGFAER